MRNHFLKIGCKVLFIIIFSEIIIGGYINLEHNNKQPTFSFPETNDSEINIITPANTTYFSPMTGYYPATYGFEDINIGETPLDWVLNESGGQIEIIGELDRHEKVLQLFDNSASDYIVLNNSILETSGIVEFWMRVAQKNTGMFTYIIGDNNYGIHFYVQENGYFTYWDGVGVRHDIEPYNVNQWYHIKIEFDLIDWHLWIDGIQKDSDGFEFYGSPTVFKKVGFSSWIPGIGYLYIDAIAYSWDLDYTIGDNLDEGLLISYTNSTNIDWVGYSLDGSNNVTIKGNKTIPLMSNGLHSIQLFVNDTLGNFYPSEIRYFTVGTSTPLPPPTPPDLTFIIYIVIGVAIAIFSLVYIKVIRPKTADARVRKKEIKMERNRLRSELLEQQRREQERLERERLEQVRIMRENEKQRQAELIRKQRMEEEHAIIEKIRKVMNVSTRVKMDSLRDYLKMDNTTFNQKIFDWAAQFNFTIDGDYLNIRKENVSDFIDELEKQFSSWRRTEEDRFGKL